MNNEVKIQNAVDAITNSYRAKLFNVLSRCESPIEKLFFVNFINCFNDQFLYNMEFITNFIFAEDDERERNTILTQFKHEIEIQGLRYTITDCSYEIFPQFEVTIDERKLRLDFAIIFNRKKMPGVRDEHFSRICIECDGHDHHERTKEQVIKDNTRQRLLQENGWRVLKYSGAEISRNGDFEHFSEIWHQIQNIAIADWRFERKR